MKKDVVHTCEVRTGPGRHRLRFVAVRRNCRPLLADFYVRVIEQRDGRSPVVCGEGTVRDLPRGLGVAELFVRILAGIGDDSPARDENGVEIPLPERSAQEWMALADEHVAIARQCWEGAKRAEAATPKGQR